MTFCGTTLLRFLKNDPVLTRVLGGYPLSNCQRKVKARPKPRGCLRNTIFEENFTRVNGNLKAFRIDLQFVGRGYPPLAKKRSNGTHDLA